MAVWPTPANREQGEQEQMTRVRGPLTKAPLLLNDHAPITEPVYNLAFLSADELAKLDGKRAMFRIELDSEDDVENRGFVLYDLKAADGTFRTVWLYRDQEQADDMVVEATVRVCRHSFCTEYRLEGAVKK